LELIPVLGSQPSGNQPKA